MKFDITKDLSEMEDSSIDKVHYLMNRLFEAMDEVHPGPETSKSQQLIANVISSFEQHPGPKYPTMSRDQRDEMRDKEAEKKEDKKDEDWGGEQANDLKEWMKALQDSSNGY